LNLDRGGQTWQRGEQIAATRDSLVHYNVTTAPKLSALDIWKHLESVMLLFIEPSTIAGRTLFYWQYECFNTLTALHPLVPEFEERPLHKGWPKEPQIFDCPFDGVDDGKFPKAHPPKRKK
jgi:hypothetical protein